MSFGNQICNFLIKLRNMHCYAPFESRGICFLLGLGPHRILSVRLSQHDDSTHAHATGQQREKPKSNNVQVHTIRYCTIVFHVSRCV
jgi:hypothetical protein